MKEIASIRMGKRCKERYLGLSAEGDRALQTKYLGGYGCGVGVSELHKTYEIFRQHPLTHVMLYTLGGKARLDLGGARKDLLPGTVCILPAGQNQAYGTDGRWNLLWFHVKANEFWNDLMPKSGVIIKSLWMERLKILAEEFLEETTRRDRAAHSHILEGYASLIALFLRRELTFSDQLGDSQHRERLEQLWQLVSANPAKEWNIDTLARTSHFSRSHLHAVTRKIYGQGVMEIVGRLRMERAVNLILNHRFKLADIAEQVGYQSPFSFSRAFKRFMGAAPQNYRIQSRA